MKIQRKGAENAKPCPFPYPLILCALCISAPLRQILCPCDSWPGNSLFRWI